jgi:hypothetical protein
MSDRDLMIRYKMALEAILQSGSFLDHKSIANKALEEKPTTSKITYPIPRD